jgi:signal peptidase I
VPARNGTSPSRTGTGPGAPRHGRQAPPLRIGAHRVGRAIPVRTPLRPPAPPADDRPTTDLGGVADAVETEAFAAVEAPDRAVAGRAPAESLVEPPADPPSEEPGAPDAAEEQAPAEPASGEPARRRRRAGESADERPASTYRTRPAKGTRRPRSGRRRRPAFWKELPLLVVVALMLTFLIQTFLAKVYVIPSGSMETTLHGCTGCVNDRVLVDKVSYRFGEPQPGDVVVFRGPDSWASEVEVDPPDSAILRGLQQFGSLIGLAPPNEKDFVKRVIAVGGQTVQCCDAANRVLVDGKPLEEPYIYYLPEAGRALQEGFGPYVVPRGYLWMMGDSRNNSADSRATGHGPVPIDNVIGKAQFIVLPVTRVSSIDAINPQAPAVGMGVAPDIGAPTAVGLLVALPLWWRRRRGGWADPHGHDEFLPGRPGPRG